MSASPGRAADLPEGWRWLNAPGGVSSEYLYDRFAALRGSVDFRNGRYEAWLRYNGSSFLGYWGPDERDEARADVVGAIAEAMETYR